jgi:hypothetical protein
MKTLVTFAVVVSFITCPWVYAADDGGLTGEFEQPNTVAALFIKQAHREYGTYCAGLAASCVIQINTAGATAFWQRVGVKGKRTLKFINDLVAEAEKVDAALVGPEVRAALSKWTATPDNTVSVAP